MIFETESNAIKDHAEMMKMSEDQFIVFCCVEMYDKYEHLFKITYRG